MGVVLTLSLADLAAPQGAAAAAAVSAADAPTPGQIQSTLPVTPQQPQLSPAPLVQAPVPIIGEVASGGPTVTVIAFDITGNSVFSTPLLLEQIASYVGKDLTLAGLYSAAETLTRFYQAHGYGVARVTVPQQQFSDGHITLQVIEGRVGKISVEGNLHTRSGAILAQGTAVKSGDIYTDPAMERAALLVSDLPGLQAQAVLQPGSVFGTTDIVYKITEEPEYSGQISVDDYGPADVGRWRLNSEVDVANPTGTGDKLSADVTHTESNELNFGTLSYSLPLGTPGGRLGATYSQSEYSVGKLFTPLGVSGSSKFGNMAYQFPEIRSREQDLFWSIGFEHEGTVTRIDPLATDPHTKRPPAIVIESNLNLLQLAGFYTRIHEDGGGYTLNASFAGNGERDDGLRNYAQRGRFELDAQYSQPFEKVWTFIGKSSAVWSPDPLADTEKYSLGGPDNVRGFLSAEARGDRGVYASAELQRSLAPAWPLALGWYVDAGRVWDWQFSTLPAGCTPSHTDPCISPSASATLTSIGTEVIFQSPGKRWESRLQWAYAVGHEAPNDGNTGGHIWATFGMNF